MVIENGEKQFRAGKFQGRVEEALKDIRGDIGELKRDFKKDLERVENEVKCVRAKVNNNRLKIAGIVASVSSLSALVTLLLYELISK